MAKALTKKQKQDIALFAIDKLKEVYPDNLLSLNYKDPFQLLVATRLAAQCTDARVNTVTPALFKAYPDMDAMSKADIGDVEKIIYSCGFYRTKAKDIVLLSGMLIERFNKKLPDNMDDLLKLPGVGRKTASIIIGDVYGKRAIVTDTHCIRIAGRLGLVKGKEPYRVEMQLEEILPPEESNDFCHRLVLFGRETCSARSPKCDACPLLPPCPQFNV